MTVRSLSKRRGHLERNRKLIIARSLAAAAAGTLPVPLVEEWLSSSIKRGLIRRVAQKWDVDIDDDAIKAIADGPARPPEWTELAGGALIYRVVSKSWRRLLLGVLAARRAQTAGHTFLVATLFDHYCAQLHVGIGLDALGAAELQALIGKAMSETKGGLSRRFFRRGLASAARATLRAPVEVADIITGGAVRRLLSTSSEVQAVTEVDEAVEKQIAATDSFLSRAAVAVELELSAESNPYIDDLIDTFERLWRQRRADETIST